MLCPTLFFRLTRPKILSNFYEISEYTNLEIRPDSDIYRNGFFDLPTIDPLVGKGKSMARLICG